MNEAPPPDRTPDQPSDQREHDESGIDLARSIARSLAGRNSGRRGGSWTGAGRPAAPRSVRSTGPSRPSGAYPDERDPQTLDANLERLVSERGWSTELRVHGVFARWGAIVGADVAAHATPESFADGRLVVRTDSTAWATQMKLLAADVVRRLNEELGDETVQVIDVHGPRGPSWRKGALRVKGRGPRDTYG